MLAPSRTFEGLVPLPSARQSAGSASTCSASTREERFRALFDRHYDYVWRILRRLGVRDQEVDDTAQEVFLVAARRLDDIREGAEKSFLFGTARRFASDARKGQRRSHTDSDAGELLEQPDPLPDPEQALQGRRAAALLDAVLDTMDDDLRAAFVLFELEGFSKSEVAEMLGIPEGTAASRLRRAREAFFATTRRLKSKLGIDAGGPQ
jgi:RNA polymerase sigma-70 factor (ECF subfamily)